MKEVKTNKKKRLTRKSKKKVKMKYIIKSKVFQKRKITTEPARFKTGIRLASAIIIPWSVASNVHICRNHATFVWYIVCIYSKSVPIIRHQICIARIVPRKLASNLQGGGYGGLGLGIVSVRHPQIFTKIQPHLISPTYTYVPIITTLPRRIVISP